MAPKRLFRSKSARVAKRARTGRYYPYGYRTSQNAGYWMGSTRRLYQSPTHPRPSEMVTIKKTVLIEDYKSSALIGVTTGNIAVLANQIGDWSTLIAVYDQFRINHVKFTLIPKMNVVGPNSVNNPAVGMIASAIDYDTSASPASLQEVLDYGSSKFTRGTDLHIRSFKPKADLGLFIGGTSTSRRVSGTGSNPWLDCNDGGDVPHRGLKIAFEDSEVYPFTYDLMMEINISFKCIH